MVLPRTQSMSKKAALSDDYGAPNSKTYPFTIKQSKETKRIGRF